MSELKDDRLAVVALSVGANLEVVAEVFELPDVTAETGACLLEQVDAPAILEVVTNGLVALGELLVANLPFARVSEDSVGLKLVGVAML